MRKLSALVLALVLVLSLAACGGNDNEPSNNGNSTPNGNNEPASPPEIVASLPPQQETDSLMRMSLSDITNMNSDTLNILLAMPLSDDFSFELTLGDIRIPVVSYAEDPDLVSYRIYDAGSEVYAGESAIQKQSYEGIWVEIMPPEDFDWGLNSVSTVKIEYTDADRNELSGEYDLGEILVSVDDAANWLSDMQVNSGSADGNSTPTQSTSPDGDTPQTDPASAFTLDASALEAAADPYEYIAAELDKVYSNVFGTAEVSDNPDDNATTSFRIRFNAYEIGSLDSTDTYMPDIEKAASEIYAAFNEVSPYNVIGIRFYILEDGNPIGYIAPNYSENLLYTEDTFYEYKDGAWVEHRYSDRFIREEW